MNRDPDTHLLERDPFSGIFRANEARRRGTPLSSMIRRGDLQRLSRGIYAPAEHKATEWHELAILSTKAPNAVISLISALAFHSFGTQIPFSIWITLPPGARQPTFSQRLMVTRFSEPGLSAGIEVHSIEGVPVQVYCPAKTVADCFKMRSKVGLDVAIEALKDGWRLRKFTIDELNEFAKVNRVFNVMQPYVETVIS